MLRKARAAGKMVSWPGRRRATGAEGAKGSGPCRAVGARVMEARVRDPWVGVGAGSKDVGARRKSRDQDFVDGEGRVGEPAERSWTMRLAGRGRVLGLGGRREGGMGSKETEGRVRSSRISLIVNAPWGWMFARVSWDVAGAFVGGGEVAPALVLVGRQPVLA